MRDLKIKEVANGAVLISCDTEENRVQLQKSATNVFGEGYRVGPVKQNFPKIELVRVDIDIDKKTDETLIKKIGTQNEVDSSKHGFVMKLVKRMKNEIFEDVSVIVEVDLETYIVLMSQE